MAFIYALYDPINIESKQVIFVGQALEPALALKRLFAKASLNSSDSLYVGLAKILQTFPDGIVISDKPDDFIILEGRECLVWSVLGVVNPGVVGEKTLGQYIQEMKDAGNPLLNRPRGRKKGAKIER